MTPSDPILRAEEKQPPASYTPPGGEPTPPTLPSGEGEPAPSADDPKEKVLGSGLSIASLVLGLFGLICCSCCGLPTGIVGIVLALVDRARRGRFDGIALAGLITSIVSILLFVFSFAVFFFLGIMDGLLDDGMVIPPAGALSLWRFL